MSYTLPIYSVEWTKLSTLDLSESVFNDDNINLDLIHEFVILQQANRRNPIAHTKTRAEVNKSWRKLYKQKKTGNARVGDAWSPIRRKWWVSFWPRNDVNYSKKMPKKMRRLALSWILTLKVKNNEAMGLDTYPFNEIKTKNAVNTLKNLNIIDKKTLLVLSQKNPIVEKSFSNIDTVKYILVDYLNPVDLLHHDNVVFLEDSVQKIQNILSA